MGKSKKFIEKKKAATYQLLARDSGCSSSSKLETDRVFVRVDNNCGLRSNHFCEDGESKFADAPNDPEGDDNDLFTTNGGSRLPDPVRREILALGFPDDGYNYLLHLREIKNSGAGSTYFQNPKTDFSIVSQDIKAYDASRVPVKQIITNNDDSDSVLGIVGITKNVKVQKAMDPDVEALLYNSDSSNCDDLEEDFIFQANLPDHDDIMDELPIAAPAKDALDLVEPRTERVLPHDGNSCFVAKIPGHRPRRPLDEQFDMVERQEYESDEEEDGYMAEEDEKLAKKLNDALGRDEMEDESYMAPADIVKRCAEYGEKYEKEDENGEVVYVEESSSESEEWDCETIVSTYSNVENHPGRIEPPTAAMRKKIWDAIGTNGSPIALGGRQKLPFRYLTRPAAENGSHVMPKKVVGLETKQDKRQRKAALKEDKRESRRIKKEVRSLYKGEAQLALRAAAVAAPASIHLM